MSASPLPPPRPARFSRRDGLLVALGLLAWIAIGFGAAWFVHQLRRPPHECGTPVEARATTPPTGAAAASPRNALQLLTGTGRCPP